MTFEFSGRSLIELSTCDERLVRVFKRALAISPIDIVILKGHRPEAEQNEAFGLGRSKLKWPKSKHNQIPSAAVDAAPYPIDWNNYMRFHAMAGVVFAAAKLENVKLRWGGDWNGNWSNKDQSFNDLPHYELMED